MSGKLSGKVEEIKGKLASEFFAGEGAAGVGVVDSFLAKMGVVCNFDVEGRLRGFQANWVKSDGTAVSSEEMERLGSLLQRLASLTREAT